MDTHILGRNYEKDPQKDPHNGVHSVIEGEDEHQPEKISVLKKVKAKAKKIKETLTKHAGHGQDHDQEHDQHHDEHDHIDFDEEDDDGDEMVEDPKVHGAPMDESAAIRSAVPGQEENIGRPSGNLGRSTVTEEDPHVPVNTPASFSPGINETKVNDMARNFEHGEEEENQRQDGGNLGRSTVLEEEPPAPKDRLEAYSPANNQTKVTDPTGADGEEAGVTSIRRSFGKMGVNDETEPKTETGSHDQFSPELAPPTKITNFPQNPHTPTKPDNQTDDNKTEIQPNQSTYTEKISSASFVIADKAISAKNVVASKLGYVGKDNNTAPDMQGSGETAKPSQVGEYGRKISATLTEKLAPVYDKVAGAGNTVASKIPGTGSGAVTEGGVKGPDKGVSVKEYLVEKSKPGDEDKALSEVITGSLGKRKEEKKAEMASPRPVTAVISDAMHKRKEEDEPDKVCRPMGKVTESEEVAKRLGTGDEDSGERVENSGNVDPVGMGVVERVKGVVSSWLGTGGDQSQTSQTSPGSTNVAEGFSSSASGEEAHGHEVIGERRLKESSN